MAAISPFNFTAIGGNLAGAPALMVSGVVGSMEGKAGAGPGLSKLQLAWSAVCKE